MICAISDENRSSLEDYHVNGLVTLMEKKQPLDVKSYLGNFYRRLLIPKTDGSIREKDQALSYIHISPGIIRQILRSDLEMENYFVNKGLNLSDLVKLDNQFTDSLNPLETVQQYVGLPDNTISDLKQQITSARIVSQQPGYDSDLYDEVESIEPVFHASPLYSKSTTGEEAIPRTPGPGVDTIDPEQKVRRFVQRMIINQTDSAGHDSRNIKIKGLYGGVYLTAMSVQKLVKAHPEITNLDPRDIVHVLTGKENEILLFDKDGNLNDSSGEVMYYSNRKVVKVKDGYLSDPPLAPIEAVVESLRKQGTVTSKEQALKDRQSDLTEQYIAAQHILKDPENNTVQSYITGGSLGYAKFDYNIKSTLSKPYPSPVTIDIEKTDKGILRNGAIYFNAKDIKAPIELQSYDIDDDFKNKIISTIVDDIKRPGETKVISDVDRMDLVKQWVANSPRRGFEVWLEDRVMVLKINNSFVDLSDKEEARRILTDYFNNFVVLSVDQNKLSDEARKKAVNGDTPGFEKTLKPNSIVYKKDSNGKIFYQKYVNFQFNISRDHLGSNYFNDYTLIPKGDHLELDSKRIAYYDWLKEHTYINYQLGPDDKLQVLNSYFTYELTDQGRETLYPETEQTQKIPKTDKGVTNNGSYSNLLPDESIDEFEKYVKKHGLQKTVDQKLFSLPATQEQIKQAKIWYDKHPLSKHFPFKTLFNVINTKTSGSIANWTLNGITLWHGSDYTDLYHESWHGFSQAFLTKDEKKDLYDEVKKRSGSFINHLGKRITFQKATPLQIEEYLGEDFRKYMLNKGDHIIKGSPVRNSIFRRIYNFLKALFGNTTKAQMLTDNQSINTVRELYEKLRVGDINEYTFDASNIMFDVLHKGIVATRKDYPLQSISIDDSNLASESIDSIFSLLIKNWNIKHPNSRMTPNMFTTKGGRELAYKHARKSLQTRLIDTIQEYTQETDPLSKARLLRNIELLNFMDDNFGKASDPSGLFSHGKGLIWYHNDKSEFLRLEDKLDEEDKQKGYQLHTRGGNETSVYDDADPGVMYLLASLHKIDPGKKKRIIALQKQDRLTDKEKSELSKLKQEPYLVNRLGYPKPGDSTNIINRLSRELQGSATPEIMEQRLLSSRNKYSFVPELLELLGPAQTQDTAAVNMWNSFFNTFNKITINHVIDTVHEKVINGKKVFESHVGLSYGDDRAVKISWDNDFRSGQIQSSYRSPFIIKKRGEVAYLNVKDLIEKYKKGITSLNFFNFLNDIGLKLTDNEEVRKAINNPELIKSYDFHFMNRLRAIRDNNILITSIKDLFGKVIKDKSGRELSQGMNGRLNSIATIQATHSESYSSGSMVDQKGDTIYVLSKNNSISTIKKVFDEAKTWQDVINNPATRHFADNPMVLLSNTYKSLFDQDGNKRPGAEFLLENRGGTSFIKNDNIIAGVSSSSADAFAKYNEDFDAFYLRGAPENPRAGEKSSSYTTRPNKWETSFSKNKKMFFGVENFADGLSGNLFSKIYTVALPYLYGEHLRVVKMQQALEDKKNGIFNKNNDAPDYVERGSTFTIFDDILLTDTKDDLYAIKGSLDQYFKRNTQESKNLMNKIQRDFKSYFTKYFDQADSRYLSLGVLPDNILKDIKKGKDNPFTISSPGDVGLAVARAMEFNSWIHNTEYSIIVSDDPAMYKPENYHKRIPMAGSTGNIANTSSVLADLINKENQEFSYSQLKGIFPRGTTQPKLFSGDLAISTLKDSIVRSTAFSIFEKAQRKELEKRFSGKELEDEISREMKPLGNITEADSQGLITYDAAKNLLHAFNTLNPKQKEAYKLSVEAAVNNTNIPVGQEGFMPVLKYQYFGPATSINGMRVMSGHKFTLFVLNPYVIKDFPIMVKQHHRMLGSGIDYMLFESGSKVQTLTNQGVMDKFYTDDHRTPDTSNLTSVTIRLEYLKDQMNLGDKYKGTSTFPTQLRKEIIRGLYEGGVPVDVPVLKDIKDLGERKRKWMTLPESEKLKSEAYSLVKNFEKAVDTLTDRKWEDLKRSIGWEKTTGTLTEKLLKVVNRQLKRAGLSQHEREYIDLRDSQSELVKFKDLSLHPSQELIEKTISALYNNKMVRQKHTGESLINLAGTGFEDSSKAPKGLTPEQQAYQYGTNGLRTYLPENRVNSDGKKVTSPSESMIPLIGPFLRLLDTYHKDGELIGKDKNNEAESLKRLNETINDPEWLKENHDLINYLSVRIPVEDQNFMKFEIPKRFLSGLAGPVAIHPPEDVGITSQDMDGDKSPTLFPNIGVIDGKAFLVRDVTESEAKDLYKEYRKKKADIIKKKMSPKEEYTAYDNLFKGIFQGYETSEQSFEEEMNEELIQQTLEMKDMTAEQIQETFEKGEASTEFIKQAIESKFSIESFEEFYSKLNGVKAAENNLLQSMIRILEHPLLYSSLVRANSTGSSKELANKLKKYVTTYKPTERFMDGTPGTMSPTRLMEYGMNLHVHQTNKDAQPSIGIEAVENYWDVGHNRVGSRMKYSYLDGTANTPEDQMVERLIDLPFDHNTQSDENKNQTVSLSSIYNVTGKKISTIITDGMDMVLEAAKNDDFAALGLDRETLPVLQYLIAAGADFDLATNLAMQPIIRQYVQEIRKARGPRASQMNTAPNSPNFFINKARGVMLMKYLRYPPNITTDETVDFNPRKNADIIRSIYNQYRSLAYPETNKVKSTLYRPKAFDLTRLENEIKKEEIVINPDNTAVLLAWLDIEDQSKIYSSIKFDLNPDTKRSISAFLLMNKQTKIDSLDGNKAMPPEVLEGIMEDSPISSFFNSNMLDLIRPVLPLHANEIIGRFLSSKLINFREREQVLAAFGSIERFSSRFYSDLNSFIYQNKLRQFDVSDPAGYRNVVSEKSDVQQIPYLKYGAFVKDNILYYDLPRMIQDWRNDNYTGKVYKEMGLAPLSKDTFDSAGEFYHYVFEREYLRSMTRLDSVKLDPIFMGLRIQAFNNTPEGTTDQEVDQVAYEEYLKIRALENIGNAKQLFQGHNSYATQVMKTIKDYNLSGDDMYPVLEYLVATTSEALPQMTNLKLTDSRLSEDAIDKFHNAFNELADYNIIKTFDSEGNPDINANTIVSRLFQKISMVAFLQSGWTATGEHSLIRLVDDTKILNLMQGALADFVKAVEGGERQRLDVMYGMFLRNNSRSQPNKNRYKDWMVRKVPGAIGIKSVTRQTPSSVRVIQTHPDYMTYYPENLTEKSVEGTIAATPKAIFIYDKATNPKSKPEGTGLFSLSDTNQTLGLPTLNYYSRADSRTGKNTSDQSLTALSDKTLEENKVLIDQAIQNLKDMKDSGYIPVFSLNGYGQRMLGLESDGVTPIKLISGQPGLKTFMYLSEALYSNFQYVNKNYDVQEAPVTEAAPVTPSPGEVLSKNQPVSDQEVRDLIKNCLT